MNRDRQKVTVVHAFAASAERVFDAFLDVDVARNFLFATDTGEMVRAEIDPRVGGRFRFVDRRPEIGEVEHVGEYLEIERPRRLVFTFGVPAFSSDMSTVAIDIRPEGDGCVLTLTHDGVLGEYAQRTRQGWEKILNGLAPAWESVKAAGWRS